MGAQAAMLCDFLDSLGISHDEHGGIENLPDCPSPEKLDGAVDDLLAKYPAENVTVYLQCFQAMDIAGWPPLAARLEKDARLHLPANPPAGATGAPPAAMAAA